MTTTTTVSTITTTHPVGSVASINYGAKLTISSTNIAVGEQVKVTGTDCPAGFWGTASLDYGVNVPFIFESGGHQSEEDFTTANGDAVGGTAGNDGRWAMSATVPMMSPGMLTLTGFCTPDKSDDNDLTSDFRYPTVPVTLTSPYQVEVQPTAALRSGTT